MIDPVFSRFALARWLRILGFADDLAMLELVISKVRDLPGFGERRDKLRRDPASVMEVLTELYFGAWMLDLGHRVEFTRVGADDRIALTDDAVLEAEVTTPRQEVWSQDLFERLDLLTERFGYAVELEHGRERLPDPGTTEQVVIEIVECSVALLQEQAALDPDARAASFEQTPADVDLRLIWRLDPTDPSPRSSTSPPPSSPWWGFNAVADAASKKAAQLPSDQAGLLVVGTRQMPALAWSNFIEALRHYPVDDMPFDLSRLPPNVKHILLYAFILKQIQPWDAILITNDDIPLPDPPGFAEFAKTMCPEPYRSVVR